MKPADLECLGHIKKTAKLLFEKDGFIAPVVVYYDGESTVPCAIPGEMTKNGSTKNLIVEFMKFLVKKNPRIIAIGFIFECWMVENPEEGRELSGSIANHPKRIEGVSITMSHRQIGNITSIAKIDRSGAKPKLLEFKDADTGTCEGRFANIFDRAEGIMN